MSPDSSTEIAAAFEQKFKRPLFAIGEITAGNQMEIAYADGTTKPITPTGWDHFKADKND
jgi:hypothetical protein